MSETAEFGGMRILYLASGQGEDYQCDALFHGLRTLLGEDACDVERIASLYEDARGVRSSMYGRGYTLYGTLPEINVDRGAISARLSRRYFDLVIYGSIQRYAGYLEEVQRSYPARRIVYVDGEDGTSLKWTLLGKGVYFKRELEQPIHPFLQPIYLAVPPEKFLTERAFERCLRTKTRPVAPCDPRDRASYRFETEEAYYQQYRESFFGITMRKAGWDCMRHHEIVSQGTAPLFIGLEACPTWTIHRLPRRELLELRRLQESDPHMASGEARARYADLMRTVFLYYKRTFTTVALAQYVLRAVADSGAFDSVRGLPIALQARWLRSRYSSGIRSKSSRVFGTLVNALGNRKTVGL